MAKIVEYIEANYVRGDGQTYERAFRQITQLWSKDGRLIGEHDPHTGQSFFNPNSQIGDEGPIVQIPTPSVTT